MLIVLLVLSIALLVWGIIAYNTDREDGWIRIGIGVGLTIIVAVSTFAVGSALYKIDHVFPTKISYLEENNLEIETKIQNAIKDYQEYEKGTYATFKPNSDSDIAIAISMYPELKSDTMIGNLLSVYQDNNNTIQELRLKQLDRPIYAFWICFGR